MKETFAKSNHIFWLPILLLHFDLLVELSRSHVRATQPTHLILFNLLRISPSALVPATCVRSIYFLGCKVTWPRANVFFGFLYDGDCNELTKSLVKILEQKFMVNFAKS
jgi:hypothetical protein